MPTKFSWSQPVKERSTRSVPSTDFPKKLLSSNGESTQSDVGDQFPVEGNDDSDSAGQKDLVKQLQARINELETNAAKDKQKISILERERDHVRSCLSQEVAQAKKNRHFGFDTIKDNNQKICFYTGFPTFNTLSACYKLLNPEECLREDTKRSCKESKIPYMDQFFLTLMRLRLGLFEHDLADRFKISQSSVHRIIKRWVNFMYLRLGSINIWLPPEVIKRTMPESMREKFPNLEWVIDAFEIQTQRPASLMLQSQTYSSYKSRNTVKGLVACTPSGQVGFISQLYTGNISDRELVLRSGFLNMPHTKGAMWLVDKGFQIQDLADPLGVTVNMPAFVGQQKQLSAQDVFKTQTIASERIHIERMINKIKKFHLFDRPVPMSMMGCVNQAWTVCALLTLFQNPIISA